MNPAAPPRSGRIAFWVALAFCVAAIFRVANNVAPWDGGPANVWHHYEYLAEGFLKGHTYLSVEPSPELLRLKDPYDPAANQKLRLWDASLYHGKYYLYYGPGPAVALMLPWRVLTGHTLPQRTAVALFACAGVAAMALLLRGVRRRHFPGLSDFTLGMILLVAFHASWLPVVIRRPGVWELPIVSAAACLWWAVYFLWRYHDSAGRARWAVAVGAALALLIACRVTNLIEAGFMLLLLLPLGGAAGGAVRGWRAFLGAAALVFAGGVALLLYNHARFGSWTEFGQSYMLAGREIRGMARLNPSFIPFNLWTYVWSMPDFGPYFPFVHATWPEAFPAGYVGYEAMYGARFAMPVHLVGFFALVWAFRHRTDPQRRGACLTLAAAVGSSFFAAGILFCWQGACSRYIAELFAGWTLVTSVGLMVLFGSGEVLRLGRLTRVIAAAAACWTVACVWLASAEFRGFMRQTNPRTYAFFAHTLDYPSQWWIQARGVPFGPVDIDVRIPANSPNGETVLVATGFPDKANQLILDRVDRDHVRLILNGNEDSVIETPRITVPTDRMHIRLSAPWLYPPPEHPYWDHVRDPSQVIERQTLFSLGLERIVHQTRSTHYFDASGFVPEVREPSASDPDSACVEALRPVAPGQ